MLPICPVSGIHSSLKGAIARIMSHSTVTIRCLGHACIRGTHHKTLEFTADTDITERATCVLGVAAAYDERDLLALRGRVEVTISAGGVSDTLVAWMCPTAAPGEALILRRSSLRQQKTLATDASKSAQEISRELVGALREPGVPIEVTFRESPAEDESARHAVVFVAPLAGSGTNDSAPSTAMLLRGADLIVPLAGRVNARDTGARSPLVIAEPSACDARSICAEARRGQRIAVLVPGSPSRWTPDQCGFLSELWGHGAEPVPMGGWSAADAALSISGCGAPVHIRPAFERIGRDLDAAMDRITGGDCAVVLSASPEDLPSVRARLAGLDSSRVVTVLLGLPGAYARVWRGDARSLSASDELLDASRLDATIVVAPASDAGGTPWVDAHALLAAIAGEKISSASLARALARASGLSRKEAYKRVLSLRGEHHDAGLGEAGFGESDDPPSPM